MFDALPDETGAPDFLPAGSAAFPAAPYGRPSWSGLLQLSLVGIPLKAYPAVCASDGPSCHQVHADCGQRIRHAKHCPVHGPVDAAAVVRAYEYCPGCHVVVEPEELLRPAPDRALRLERFLEPARLDPLLFAGRALYLVPDGRAAEPAYAVLRAVMAERGCWALGRVVLGGHRQLVLVRPSGAVLLLHVLHYPEQVRACPRAAGPQPSGSSEERHLAGLLIDTASGAVDWPSYRDETAQELRGLVEAKLQGQPAAAVDLENRVLPLLEALRQSVAGPEATGAARGRRQARVPRERGRRT
jgi:DNA end-binding protein Ku